MTWIHQIGGSTSSRPHGQAKAVPDSLVGELSRFVCRSGSKGIDKIVTDFTAIHPEASKRQVEKKIQVRSLVLSLSVVVNMLLAFRRVLMYSLVSRVGDENSARIDSCL